MLQEKLVSLESSKKLKKLGFNELCDNCNNSSNENIIVFDLKGFYNTMKDIITRPTQCHVQRWLFKQGYFVSTSFSFKEFDKDAKDCDNAKMLFVIRPEIYTFKETKPFLFDRSFMSDLSDIILPDAYSNEEVLGIAIDYAIDKMIQIKNESKSDF